MSSARMKVGRRSFLAAMAALGAGVLVAACGTAATPTPAPAAPPAKPAEAPKPTEAAAAKPAAEPTKPAAAQAAGSKQPVTLRIHGRQTPIDDVYAQTAEKFTTKHPEVKVEYERTPGQEYTQKQLLMAASKTSGDAFWACSICLFRQFAISGVFIDHSPMMKSVNWNWDDFIPAAKEGVTYEGKIYGVPTSTHPGLVGLIINKTLFQKENVPLPKEDWTLTDFTEIAQKLTKKSGDKVTQWGYDLIHHFYYLVILLRSNGIDYLNKPELNKIQFDQSQGVEAISWLADLRNKYKAAPFPADFPQGGPNAFASGRVGARLAGVYNLQGAREQYKDFEWMAVPHPRGKAGLHGMFEFDGWSVLNTSQQPELAFELLTDFASKELGLNMANLGAVPGSRKVVWEDARLNADPNFAVFAKIHKDIDPLTLPANHRSNELWQTSDKLFDKLFTGEDTDARKVVKETSAKLNEILAKPPPGLQG